jgi:hypothetical protein
MDLIDRIKQISERINKLKDQVPTEEATKNAFVLPFLQALGYDVFNPLEVIPEFTADIGIKKGEKVDYCILKDGEPALLIECKHWNRKLNSGTSQLHRYFHVTNARFAILINGIKYLFFTDLVKKNVMDEKPFMEFSMDDISEAKINPIKQFHKDNFNIEAIVDSASDLKFSKEIKDILYKELTTQPSDEFVKFFAQQVYTGRTTAKVIDQFREIVQRSVKTLVNDLIQEKLQFALDANTSKGEEEDGDEDGIVTTDEELSAFRIVQAILAQKIDIDRIFHRDRKTYFGILLDDNNRKTICRLHFNGGTKYLGLFDQDRNEHKIAIKGAQDIYQYRDLLLESMTRFEEV